MKSSLLAGLVWLLFSAGMATAEYIIIKIDLNKEYLAAGAQGPGMPGVGGPGQGPGPGGNQAFPIPAGGQFPQGTQPGAQPPPPGVNPQPGMVMPGQPGANTEPETPPVWVYAFVELKAKPKFLPAHPNPKLINPFWFVTEVEHQWGKMAIIPRVLLARNEVIFKDSLNKEFLDRLKKEKKTKDVGRFLNLAQWAMVHGQWKSFHTTMDEAQKLDGKHPLVISYNKVKTALKAAPAEEAPTLQPLLADLKNDGYRSVASDMNHYVLYHNMAANPGDDQAVKQRLARMEETLESFYYWFAMQDQVPMPSLPKRRLVAVLVKEPKDFHSKHVYWGSQPMAGDAFTPRRDNIMVLSAGRLDEPYAMLGKNLQSELTKLNVGRDELLSGDIWTVRLKKDQALMQQIPKLALVQTYTLVQKAMEEESERSSITHEGTRQLLYATGLLPRNVLGPEWLPAGLASFFETSPNAFYTSTGLPSWSHLVNFKFFRDTGKLGKPEAALSELITDGYFRRMQQSLDALAEEPEDKEKLAAQAREDTDIARCTAWAFVYYLAQKNELGKLLRFCQEMNNMPRDLEMNERVWQGCFARAFGMADRNDSHCLNLPAFKQFAEGWFAEMSRVTLEMGEVEREMLQWRREAGAPRKTPTTPAMPGPPGIPPMVPASGHKGH